jgi:hypothetical protein
VQAEGVQRVQDAVGCPWYLAGPIKVFHAHQPGPTPMAGIEKTTDRGDQ